MSVEVTPAIVGVALTGVGLLIAGFWAVATLAGRQFEKRLEERFKALTTALQDLQRIGAERLERLEKKYELLDADVRRILIELPRDYVARTDYVRRETIMEGKIDQLGLRIENWMLKGGRQQ